MTARKVNRDSRAVFELEVMHLAREHGLKTDSVPTSAPATLGNGGVQITPTFSDQPWNSQCDGQHALPAWLVTALDGHEFVALRIDRDEAVALISLRTLMEMMQ